MLPVQAVGGAELRVYAGRMAVGEVLWYDEARGFGFIRPDFGPRDVFVHVSALAETGITTLAAGKRVEFELTQTGDGRLAAYGVRPAAPPKPKGRRRRRGR